MLRTAPSLVTLKLSGNTQIGRDHECLRALGALLGNSQTLRELELRAIGLSAAGLLALLGEDGAATSTTVQLLDLSLNPRLFHSPPTHSGGPVHSRSAPAGRRRNARQHTATVASATAALVQALATAGKLQVYNRPCAQQYVGKSQACMVI